MRQKHGGDIYRESKRYRNTVERERETETEKQKHGRERERESK
jgi:hypothetical protein